MGQLLAAIALAAGPDLVSSLAPQWKTGLVACRAHLFECQRFGPVVWAANNRHDIQRGRITMKVLDDHGAAATLRVAPQPQVALPVHA